MSYGHRANIRAVAGMELGRGRPLPIVVTGAAPLVSLGNQLPYRIMLNMNPAALITCEEFALTVEILRGRWCGGVRIIFAELSVGENSLRKSVDSGKL